MDNTENIISFCTGYGGIELGLHRVIENLRTVCYVEIETFAVANLVAKIEQGKLDTAPIWSDIKTFPAQIFRDKVHGIVGGYPCQPFSAAGKRQGTADPRHLWPYILGHIRTIRPVWCFFENVSGHLALGFDEVFKSLRDLHYKVEAGLFTAAEIGAPHRRERLFILAYSQSRGLRGTEQKCDNQENQRGRGCNIVEPTQAQSYRATNTNQYQDIRKTELANSNDGQLKQKLQCNGTKPQRSGQLADTDKERTQRPEPERATPTGRQIDEQSYPARPGQTQYEWEEPRVLVRRKIRKGDETVKPGMGRTVDGFKSRVDELRLLGNGVVPAQAELAFRTLSGKI